MVKNVIVQWTITQNCGLRKKCDRQRARSMARLARTARDIREEKARILGGQFAIAFGIVQVNQIQELGRGKGKCRATKEYMLLRASSSLLVPDTLKSM